MLVSSLVEGVPEQGKLEHVAARVDLGDRPLLGAAIALLDDPEEAAGGIAEDPPESGRIGDDGGPEQAGGPFHLLDGEQVGQGLGADQRLVADQDQGRSPVILEQRVARLDGVAGAELSLLGGEMDVGLAVQRHPDLVGAIADDDDDRPGPRPPRGLDHVADHRPAADLVEDLGLLRLHPLAMPRRQDDRHRTLYHRIFPIGTAESRAAPIVIDSRRSMILEARGIFIIPSLDLSCLISP